MGYESVCSNFNKRTSSNGKNVQIFNVKKLKVVLENFLFVPGVMLHAIALLIVKKNIGKMDMNTNASHKNILKNVQIVKNVKREKTYFFFCSRCRSVRYCSKECQTNHWKRVHEKKCKNLQH